jgi:phosphoglycolate phosphatase
MDGTLINSGAIISNTINYVRINTGLKPMDSKILLENINNPNINPAKFFYNTDIFTPKHSKLFEEYYDANCLKLVELYDGIDVLLEQLTKDGYLLAIATNASNEFAVKTTKYLNIHKYFKYIIGYDDVKEPKPKPDMILKTLDYFNIKSNDTIVVGDSKKDCLSAKNANVKCMLVNWGFTKYENCIVYNNTSELYQAITN